MEIFSTAAKEGPFHKTRKATIDRHFHVQDSAICISSTCEKLLIKSFGNEKNNLIDEYINQMSKLTVYIQYIGNFFWFLSNISKDRI